VFFAILCVHRSLRVEYFICRFISMAIRREDVVGFLRVTCVHENYNRFSASPFSSSTDSEFNTDMHLTTDFQRMRSLLEDGADVEAENFHGQRPIHAAVIRERVELVELLIQHGANVNAADFHGYRPLHASTGRFKLDVVQLLVEHGAKINVQNNYGITPLHIAVKNGQSDIIEFLLKEGADIALTDDRLNTPLHYLAIEQLANDRLTEYITKQNKKYDLLIRNALGLPVQLHTIALGILYDLRHIHLGSKKTAVAELVHTDCYGNTPLHHVVGGCGHFQMEKISTDAENIVEFLVKRGVDINARNIDGLTPLHVADGKQAVKACLQHADLTAVGIRHRNFWHSLFLFNGQYDYDLVTNIRPIIPILDANYAIDDLDRTPLHYACMNRYITFHRDLTKEFVCQFNDTKLINKQDKFGRTALHYAAMTGNTETMKLLKMRNADDTVRDNFEKNAKEYKHIVSQYQVIASPFSIYNVFIFVERKFSSLLLSLQLCFFDRTDIRDSCKAKLQNIIYDLRDCIGISYASGLSMFCKCCFDYSADSDVACEKPVVLKRKIYDRVDAVSNDHASTTQPSTMFAAIQSEVDKAMKYLAEEISAKDARFACEVVSVGSAYEGTKIGYCDEFDYNFVLINISKSCSVCYSPESPPGFVLLKASTSPYDEELFNNNGILNTRIVNVKFETLVKQVLSSLSFCVSTEFESIFPVYKRSADSFPQKYHLPSITTLNKLNTRIELALRKPVNGCHVMHRLSVDIVPALRIDNWWLEDTRKELCQQGECLIVFAQPQNNYPWIGWTEPHGFISFARAESRLLRDLPKVIKAAFMVVKHLCKFFYSTDELVSSHVIKTALFWCLDEDRSSSDCTSPIDNDDVNEDELMRWVRNILRRFLCFSAQDYVPSYFMPKCHQPVWPREEHLKHFHMYLYQRGLTYKDVCSSNEEYTMLSGIRNRFLYSHVMYWTMSADTDELKLFVPSTINPLTEEDVCIQLC